MAVAGSPTTISKVTGSRAGSGSGSGVASSWPRVSQLDESSVNIPSGVTGPQGPAGPAGPPGPAGTVDCPTGSTFGKLVINAPGGQTAVYACIVG